MKQFLYIGDRQQSICGILTFTHGVYSGVDYLQDTELFMNKIILELCEKGIPSLKEIVEIKNSVSQHILFEHRVSMVSGDAYTACILWAESSGFDIMPLTFEMTICVKNIFSLPLELEEKISLIHALSKMSSHQIEEIKKQLELIV